MKQALSLKGAAPWRAAFSKQSDNKSETSSAEKRSRRHLLHRMIETGVLPELLRTHDLETPVDVRLDQNWDSAAAMDPACYLDLETHVTELATAAALGQTRAVEATLADLTCQPLSVAELCLQVLQPAARLLGKMWESDECNFSQVTLGTLSLQRILQTLSPTLTPQSKPGPAGRAMLTVVPGEQHRFGANMVAEFLRADGWDVVSQTFKNASDLAEYTASGTFDLVGLSLGRTDHLDGLKATIHEIHRVSGRTAPTICVGGPVVSAHPDLAATCLLYTSPSPRD